MSSGNHSYDILRGKLDILGYNQNLPPAAVPLVESLFEDLIKTTESLRNAKLQIAKYLDEKTCWELGIEPYKCDNSRLVSECNSLHLELIKQKDDFEEKIWDYRQRIRNLETDKQRLEEHCAQLEKNARDLVVKVSGVTKTSKNDVNMSRKPFVSTVKSGIYIPNQAEPASAYRCTKCSSIVWTKHIDGKVQEVQLLQNGLQSQLDQIALLKEKLERRDREISRLNDLLSGGRPAEALAKDCCYKNVGTLSEDIDDLQKEKVELLKKYRNMQDAMHEAMQRAISLEEKNKHLERELKELQKEALSVESEANLEMSKKESEISFLRKELDKVKHFQEKEYGKSSDDKRKLYEQLNSLTQREKELLNEMDRLKKKNAKLKLKIASTQQDGAYQDTIQTLPNVTESEVNRYKKERDYFQEEYLKLVEQSVSHKEVEMLKSELEFKNNEIKALSEELVNARYTSNQLPDESRPSSCHSVQAAILRAERERDVLKEEIRLLRLDRDRLQDKLDYAAETGASDRFRIEDENRALQNKIHRLEKEKHELLAAHIPEKTQLTFVKEELEEMKRRAQDLQSENHKLSTTNNQLRILQDQTEKALIDHQNKLLAAETNLENAECQLNTLNTIRESTRHDVGTLHREIAQLKSSNVSLEAEKEKIISELDTKTEKIYQLEYSLKSTTKEKQELQYKVKVLEKKLCEVDNKKEEIECGLHEVSTESKTLRDEIHTLKLSKDQALLENGRMINDLAEATAELRQVKQHLRDSEKEVEKLKKQLQQYVKEVKRAEELLLLKEQEREEMLEHYHSLSQDAVLLEGNNQSLEMEAAEHKQQLCDAQTEIDNLKQELAAKDVTISKLESQVSLLSSQIAELQAELDQNYDELRISKVDLEASKELIAKLDVERDKLNAELEESKSIRCQLEKEVRQLQDGMMNSNSKDRNFGVLEELLCCTQKDLESQRRKTSRLDDDMATLKRTIKELEDKLISERKMSQQHETLAREYSLKIQELQQSLTNARFQKARTEESPRVRSYQKEPYVICPYKPAHTRELNTEKSTKYYEKASRTKAGQDFASSMKAITKNFSSEEKRALEHDIKEFLSTGKTMEVSKSNTFHEYCEKVSLDEDSSDIIVRRRKTIRTETYDMPRKKEAMEGSSRVPIFDSASIVSHSMPTTPVKTRSPKERSARAASELDSSYVFKNPTISHSISPSSFLTVDVQCPRRTKEFKVKSKDRSPRKPRITSDPETEFSKNLQMKTNHRFKGNLDFTTAVKLKVSPRRKARRRNQEPTTKASHSETNVYFMKKPPVEDKEKLKELKSNNAACFTASSGDTTSYLVKPSKESCYPKSSGTETTPKYFTGLQSKQSEKVEALVKNNETSDVLIISPHISSVKIEDSSTNESKYHSVPEKSSHESQPTDKKSYQFKDLLEYQDVKVEKASTSPESPEPEVEESTLTPINISDPAAGCSCMKSKKMQILASYNLLPNEPAECSTYENIYSRTYKLCRSGNNKEGSSSSEFNLPTSDKGKPKVDVLKLLTPPNFSCCKK